MSNWQIARKIKLEHGACLHFDIYEVMEKHVKPYPC